MEVTAAPSVSTTASGKEPSAQQGKDPSAPQRKDFSVPYVKEPTTTSAKLRYIDTPYGWPFSFKNKQQLSGTFPRLMELVAKDLKLELTTLIAPDVRTLTQIHAQLADATTIITYQSPISSDLNKEDYPDFIHICETPLITGSMALISIRSIPELEGEKPAIPNDLRIGAPRLSSAGDFLDKPFNSDHKILQFNTIDLMLKSFIAGRIDAFIGDPLININRVNKLAQRNISVNEYPIGKYQLLFVFGKHWKGDSKDQKDLCSTIAHHQQIGTIDAIQASVIKENAPPQQ